MGKLDSVLLLNQLQQNSVLEDIKVYRQGFPHRFSHVDFLNLYRKLTLDLDLTGVIDGDSCREVVSIISYNFYLVFQIANASCISTRLKLDLFRFGDHLQNNE